MLGFTKQMAFSLGYNFGRAGEFLDNPFDKIDVECAMAFNDGWFAGMGYKKVSVYQVTKSEFYSDLTTRK